MTLYQLLDRAVTTTQQMADGRLVPVLATSRRAPMRTAIKRYGDFLGIDPRTAGPDLYHRPEHEVKAVIASKAPDTLADNTRRNLANDLMALLRIGVDQGWLVPLPPPLLSWNQHRAERSDGVKWSEEPMLRERYRLAACECPVLRDEIETYLAWCEAPVARNRPRAIVKRPITSKHVRDRLLRLAGFAVRQLHYAADTLTLAQLCQLDVLEAYANWKIDRRGKVTATLMQDLIAPDTIARHWLKDPELANGIKRMMESLPPAQAVRQKDRHWLSLETLESVGRSIHPLNPRRLMKCPWIRKDLHRYKRARTAWYVEFSLMMRLLIRVPMRQRCLREMQLERNLFRDHSGTWQIRFLGAELKIDRVGGTLNRYEFAFPADLVGALEEWLNVWRPKLATPGESHVFLSMPGRPFVNHAHIGEAFCRLTHRFTGVPVNPHNIRDIWATEYLNATGDVAGCARRLGNTIQMVMLRYAHIIKKDADARADTFLQGTFANGKSR
jgi:hypothetical protein